MKESSQLGQGGREDQAQHFLHESVPTLITRDLPEAAAAWGAELGRDKDSQGLFLPHFSGERVRNSFCVFHFFQLHTATLLLGTAVSLVGLKGSWSPCLAGLLTGGGLTHQQDSLISFKVTHRSLRCQLRPLKPVSGCWGALPEHQPAPLFVSILPWANETLWPCSQGCLKHSEGP